jgi:hypothetical protein
VVALLAAATVLVRALRSGKGTTGGSVPFLRWMATMVAVLALIAIVWDGLPVLLVPGCG